MNRTPLYSSHIAMGAKMVPFAGWEMPIHYGSQIDEHHCVRTDAGMFDVSHMTIVDVTGEQAQAFLAYLLANDIGRLHSSGQALYSCMLNEQGGVIDDLIVYALPSAGFRLVLNAATRAVALDWMRHWNKDYAVEINPRPELAMIAVQGPTAIAKMLPLLPATQRDAITNLQRFASLQFDEWLISRTGYTGEDGVEVMLPHQDAVNLWSALQQAGVQPVGLGARDTLRLEAGMNLYGSDMDQTTTPLESGLGWTVAWEPSERQFIGRDALQTQRDAGVKQRLVGLQLQAAGVLRAQQPVFADDGAAVGVITSGTYSPTMQASIAFARVPAVFPESCTVGIRQKRVPARIVKYPFVRNGKPVIHQ